jgi:hypothetical protein
LYTCVKRTVEDDLPREIDYLRRHDQGEFKKLNDEEVPLFEGIVREAFEGFDEGTHPAWEPDADHV